MGMPPNPRRWTSTPVLPRIILSIGILSLDFLQGGILSGSPLIIQLPAGFKTERRCKTGSLIRPRGPSASGQTQYRHWFRRPQAVHGYGYHLPLIVQSIPIAFSPRTA